MQRITQNPNNHNKNGLGGFPLLILALRLYLHYWTPSSVWDTRVINKFLKDSLSQGISETMLLGS